MFSGLRGCAGTESGQGVTRGMRGASCMTPSCGRPNRRRIEATDDEALTGGPEEGTNEAVQSGSEGTNEADRSGSVGELEQALVDSLALPFSDVSQTEEAQAPPSTLDNGSIPGNEAQLDTTRNVLSVSVSVTRPRLPLEGLDPEPDPEVTDPSYRPSLHCMRELLSFAE